MRSKKTNPCIIVFRCLYQATYLKFGEYVDILVKIIYAKFKNDKDNGYTGCKKIENFLLPTRISAVCISLLCYSTMSKLLASIVRDTGNQVLVH